ncbi:DUF2336 domain-containing protein [Magnetospira sp. QH-2]|uniref:DUF2336 domain-containing protein n=1 Tax=Magnetospira sp. (strain QH-2) TaxID=1288970 RepID=UPI0003E80D13|nr:DUF2336 domain-containing protein [Magnetospira sp. QH-2]CCQ72215.1 conserved protein of unknown function [Magnetospira sp. QH-2]
MSDGLDKLLGEGNAAELTYEEARTLARHDDPAVRQALAERDDIRPEILYFLAEDASAEVRRIIAGNSATPHQADHLLARDGDEGVRSDLAGKIARLAPELSAFEAGKVEFKAYELLVTLTRDQAVRVRRVIAETLKDVADAPAEVIGRLARDDVLDVCGPVLQFSPVLSDEDLLEIIQGAPVQGALGAIARRSEVAEVISDAIAETDDVPAIADLLGNASAQIREETLDAIIDRAKDVKAWHKPLTERPKLHSNAARRLAGIVARRYLKTLSDRSDLDETTADRVRAEVERRLAEEPEDNDEDDALWDDPDAARVEEAESLHNQGLLTEDKMMELFRTDRPMGEVALATKASLRPREVRKILSDTMAKPLIALAWKATLSPGFGDFLQIEVVEVDEPKRLLVTQTGDFPLSETDLEWEAGLFG